MKQFRLYFLLGVIALAGCSCQNETILQKEEINISSVPKEYILPESTSGTINFECYLEPNFDGLLLLKNDSDIVFKYKLYTQRKSYPLDYKIGEWQSFTLHWNIASSSLSISVNNQLQTTCLAKTEKNISINQFEIKSLQHEKEIKVKNISFQGDFETVSNRLEIVSFGNSTTAYRKTITGVYSQRVPELLLKEGIPNILFNEGVGGSHTGRLADNNRHKVEHALDRFEKSVLEKSPDIVILCFGLNDSWHDKEDGQPRIPLEYYESNLRYMIQQIKENNSEVILLTPNALGNKFEKWRYDYTQKYVEVVRTLSAEYDVSLIDQWATFERYVAQGNDIDELLLDGLHPNDIWHEKLAIMLAKEIKSIYNKRLTK